MRRWKWESATILEGKIKVDKKNTYRRWSYDKWNQNVLNAANVSIAEVRQDFQGTKRQQSKIKEEGKKIRE